MGKKPNGYWTRERIIESAKKFDTRTGWRDGDASAYVTCRSRGWMDDPEVTGHMKSLKREWDRDKLIESARQFDTRNGWIKGDASAYQTCRHRGWLDDPEITGHMKETCEKWDRDKVIESARQFHTKSAWSKGDHRAYDACIRWGWLDDPEVTGHMQKVYQDWDKPKIIESAGRFNTRSEWQKGDNMAYEACRTRGWLDDPDITGHMVSGYGSTDNDAVYLYEFEYAGVRLHKIGLTSIRRNTGRIEMTMKKAGCTATNVILWHVEGARDIERKMLEVGQPQDLYKGDGFTEMRILTPQEQRRVMRIAGDACISDPVYIERVP